MNEIQNIEGQARDSSQQPGIFTTKIPSAVTFGVGILLFFMPFVDIRCNSITLKKVTGVELATGFEIKGPGSDDTVVGDFERMDDSKVDVHFSERKNDPNIFALVALAMAALAFIFSLIDNKKALTGAVITGALGVAALIGAMIDIKRKVEVQVPEIISSSGYSAKAKNDLYISIHFTPWFYIATLAFIAATWFCYRRMQVRK